MVQSCASLLKSPSLPTAGPIPTIQELEEAEEADSVPAEFGDDAAPQEGDYPTLCICFTLNQHCHHATGGFFGQRGDIRHTCKRVQLLDMIAHVV